MTESHESHESMLVTDGTNLFRIVNGQRVWVSAPSPDRIVELFKEQLELEVARNLQQLRAEIKWK